jgi:hypothetical protein
MADSRNSSTATDTVAYERGRRAGFATAALVLAIVSYVNLFGIEKSALAAAFALLSLKGTCLPPRARVRSRAALGLAAIHAVTIIVLVVVYADNITLLGRQLVELYQSLS